jgi:hypothetical protein
MIMEWVKESLLMRALTGVGPSIADGSMKTL